MGVIKSLLLIPDKVILQNLRMNATDRAAILADSFLCQLLIGDVILAMTNPQLRTCPSLCIVKAPPFNLCYSWF